MRDSIKLISPEIEELKVVDQVFLLLKKIIELHDGEIIVDSKLQEGTKFDIIFAI